MRPEVFDRESRMLIELALVELSPTDEYVMRKRLAVGTGHETLLSIARSLSVTRERVRQREARAIRMMRTFLGYRHEDNLS